MRVRYNKNTLGRIRLGFSVSAKTGNAVQRNLFKRRLRQYSVEKQVKVGFDAVIFPVIPLKKTNWKIMYQDMEDVCLRAEQRFN